MLVARNRPRLAAPLIYATTHQEMTRSQLLNRRSWTGNHVLLPSYGGESRVMDQEVFSALSQTSFASWSLGRYTVVMSRLEAHPISSSSLISVPKVLEDLAGSTFLYGLCHRWKKQWSTVSSFNAAHLQHLTRRRVRVAQDRV